MSPAMAPIYSHARELRTIGQQLDNQGIDIFDLRYQDGDYFLECADPQPPFTDLIQLRYSALDLQSLEVTAAQERSAGFTPVDFESMAESLRATGHYVERLNAKLLRISAPDAALDGNLFRIEYLSRDGRHCSEGIRRNDVAELTIRMYKERARINGSRDHRSAM